jgi:hypothetical protein
LIRRRLLLLLLSQKSLSLRLGFGLRRTLSTEKLEEIQRGRRRRWAEKTGGKPGENWENYGNVGKMMEIPGKHWEKHLVKTFEKHEKS